MRFWLPCGRFWFLGSCIWTEDTEDCLLRPDPSASTLSPSTSPLSFVGVCCSCCRSEVTDETCSDDSTLSLVLALSVVVEPPASFEKYSFEVEMAGAVVLGLTSWGGSVKLTEGMVSAVSWWRQCGRMRVAV